jgi:NADH-quinone oxidoreductase subunit H
VGGLAGLVLMAVAVLAGALGLVAYLTWLERKFAARIQNRVGPYWVGYPHGWLQPIADLLKLLVKEDIVPRRADRLLFELAPLFVLVPALAGFAFLPFGKGRAVADHPVSLALFLALASVSLLGIFAAGWGSNNKYALLSALRMVALLVSYEIPLLLALLVPATLAGSLRLVDIVEAQRGVWFVFLPGVGQLALGVFLLSTLAEANKAPLDIVEAESELVAAYNVEYTGIKFALFYAAEYAHTLAWSGLGATVFLGGYLGPGFLPGAAWLVLKSLGLFALLLWIRWSFVRMRVDQAMALNWRLLFPVSLASLLVAGLWQARG